ncbi:MAG: sugar ABC transporter permease [Acidimicrobiia bacterium]
MTTVGEPAPAPEAQTESPDQPTGAPPRRRWSRRRREALLGLGLILPAVLLFGVFVFYPFLRNFELALYRTAPFPGLPDVYVGFDQIREVLGSSYFWNSFGVTIMFAVLTVPIGLVLGLGLAVLAHQKLKGMAIYRTIFSSTVATSVAVASVIFGTLLNPVVGLLPWLGLDPDIPYLENPNTVLGVFPIALVAVAIATIWQNLGLSFILMSSGLQAVPDDLLEAAEVDGAGTWSRFRNVTLPMLSPTIFFAVVVGGIFAFQTFGQIDLLTQGGPDDKTNVLTFAIVSQLRDQKDAGSAAVLAIALFVVTLSLTLFQMRFLERRVNYER